MDEITQVAKEEVLRNGYHKPVVAFYGRKIDGNKGKGLFIIEAEAHSQTEKAQLLYMAGAKLESDNVFSKLDKVFLVTDDWVKSEPEWIVGLHICCLDLETNKMTSRTFEYIKDEKGNVKDFKPVWMDVENNNPNPIVSAFVAGFNGS